MKLLKWIAKPGQNCKSCYFYNKCGAFLFSCKEKFGNPPAGSNEWEEGIFFNQYWHYASREQIEGLVTEAEERYTNSNGLFICSKAEKCQAECLNSTPHEYPGHYVNCSLHPDRKRVPYRGERPKKENDMDDSSRLRRAGNLDALGKVKEPTSNPLELGVTEYKIVKNFSAKILAISDIDAETFKYMVRVNITRGFIGKGVYPNGLWKYGEIDIAAELLRLGFIEPVEFEVKEGDFLRKDDSLGASIFRIMPIEGNIASMVCIYGNRLGVAYEQAVPRSHNTFKLSDLVPNPEEYTPVTVEIKEV